MILLCPCCCFHVVLGCHISCCIEQIVPIPLPEFCYNIFGYLDLEKMATMPFYYHLLSNINQNTELSLIQYKLHLTKGGVCLIKGLLTSPYNMHLARMLRNMVWLEWICKGWCCRRMPWVPDIVSSPRLLYLQKS
jgi:hypothetical protein